ncbi:hypothetical protein D3C75_821870 [compost metagenome]
MDPNPAGTGQQFDRPNKHFGIDLLNHAGDVGAFLATQASQLSEDVLVVSMNHQSRGLITVEMLTLGNLPTKHVLQFAEAAIAQTLCQPGQCRGVDVQLLR